MGFDGSGAIVTGAGSGIGRAVAVRLAAGGAHVAAADVDAGRLDELGTTCVDGPGSLTPIRADVSKPADVDELVAAAAALGDGLRIVCNVAGILDAMAPVHEVDDEQWARVLGVNLNGPFHVCRRAVPELLRAGGGSIVNVASIAALKGGTAGTAYTVSKHALIGLTRSIAWMYADAGIRCNAVCPGGVATSIGTSAPVRSQSGTTRMGPGLAQAVRTGRPEEVAGVVAFLASADASLVNGAVVTADAGWSAG